MSEKDNVYLSSSPLEDLIISKSDRNALTVKLSFARIRGELYVALIQGHKNIGNINISSLQKQVSFMMADIIADSKDDVLRAYYEKNDDNED